MNMVIPNDKSFSNGQVSVGIDVSKAHLDAAIYPSGQTLHVPNTRKGHNQLLRWIGKADVFRVVFEATGPWHKEMERALATAGLPTVKVNLRYARHFAEATGTLTKTDRIDAQMLARFGALIQPKICPIRSEIQETLTELVSARRSLTRDRTAVSNRLQALSIDLLKRHARHRLRQIDAQLASIADAIRSLIASDPELARRCEIILSIPGFGAATAEAVLADMPELGTLGDGQVSALAGLAPMTRQSGTFQGRSHIRGGRALVRQALYMPALVAMRFNPDLKAFYNRLITQGKNAKLAITAVMRKMIVLANALLRDNRIWTEKRA